MFKEIVLAAAPLFCNVELPSGFLPTLPTPEFNATAVEVIEDAFDLAEVASKPAGVLEIISAGRKLNEWVHAKPGRSIEFKYSPGFCQITLVDGPNVIVGRGGDLADAVKDAFK